MSCNQRRCSLPRRVNPASASDRRQLVGRVGSGCLPVRQTALGRLEVLGRGDENLSAVRGPGGQHSFVLGDPFAELAVEYPGVAACRQGRVGLAGQRTGDLFSRVPLVGQGTAVVDDRHPGGVPGVGGLAGTGLAGVAPVGVQGGAAEQVAGFPGAALRPVDRACPGVRKVGRTVLAGALHERRRQAHSFPAAVEPDGEAVAVRRR